MLARNGFDKLAHLYRWMEYLSFGPLLWRMRTAFLPELGTARNALVLGDGDGRFSAALLREHREVQVHAVDASGAMLRLLLRRAWKQGDAARVRVMQADATVELPDGPFNLVCSHFFLDCLDDAQCGALAARVAQRMHASARWVISEFAVPCGLWSWPARVLIAALYAAFALMTGLRVRHLPDHAGALRAAGLECIAVRCRLAGTLRAEVWVPATKAGAGAALARATDGRTEPWLHPTLHE